MTELFSKLLTEYGLSTAILILLVVLFIYFMKWFMGQVEVMRTSSLAREESLLGIIRGHQDALNKHTEQAKDFHNEVKTAHEFQRKEHEALSKEHEAIMKIASGIQEALGRINGYKHD